MCVEGPSGVLRILQKRGLVNLVDFTYNKSSWQIGLKDGQKIHMFGADNPDAGRGFNLSGVWADEIAKWRYSFESWHEGIAPALRIGQRPRAVVTTTPKPIRILREWMGRTDGSVYVTRGSTFDNAANLAAGFLKNLNKQFAGTKLEAQEIYAQMIDETAGALWTPDKIVYERPPNNDWLRIVVAVDPADTNSETSDETGIIVIGLNANQQAYVLEDATYKAAPSEWVKKVVALYHQYQADRVVAEVNKGGDMVKDLLMACDPHISYKGLRATRGKALRAEPIVSLYEQGKVKHIGPLPALETQLCTWVPEASAISPDRLDALVWGLTDLFLSGEATHQYKVWV
jgi:phage terminase large subunit-like protein